MNRIFELAKQADLIQWDALPSGARTPNYESCVKANRFAEMIVQDAFQHLTNIGQDYAREQLERYFGVKE